MHSAVPLDHVSYASGKRSNKEEFDPVCREGWGIISPKFDI